MKTKQLTLRLDQQIYEELIRIFPKYGAVTYLLRATIREAIKQAKDNPELLNLSEAVQVVLNSAGIRIRTTGID